MKRTGKANSLEKAMALHQAGQLEAADKAYSSLLKRKPRDVQALHLRGTLKSQQHEYVMAEHLLKKAVELGSTDPWAHHHLAEVLAARGKHERALKHYNHALNHGADDADVHFMLGNALFELERFNDATFHYRTALQRQPDGLECQLNLANALEASGDLIAAIALLEPLAKPDSPLVIRLQFIDVLLLAKRGLQADACVRAINHIDLEDCDHLLSVVRQLHLRGRHQSVRHLLKLLLPHADALSSQQFDLAMGLLTDSGLYSQADAHMTARSATHERSAWSWYQSGLCAQVAGDFDAAAQRLTRALTLDAELGVAAYSLASNGNTAVSDTTVNQWLHASDSDALDIEQRAKFAFAAACTLDKDDKCSAAIRHYQRANALMAGAQPFDIDAWEADIDALIKVFTAEFFADQRKRLQLDSLPSEHRGGGRVFIVGMPRSGSTLLERLLAERTDLYVLGEHHALYTLYRDLDELTDFQHGMPDGVAGLRSEQLHALRRRYTESLPIPGANGTVDKLLSNFLRLGLVALMFPDAKILHSCRNPLAVGVSCYTNAFIAGLHYTYDQYATGRVIRSYQRLMQHWHEVLPNAPCDIHYESLVTDTESEMDAILRFLGVPTTDTTRHNEASAGSTPISTASFWQARQAVNTRAIDAWQRFDAQLAPLRAGLNGDERPL